MDNSVTRRDLERIEEDIKEVKDEGRQTAHRLQLLETRTTINERDIKGIQDTLSTIKENTQWLKRAFGGAAITAVIGTLLVAFVKFLLP